MNSMTATTMPEAIRQNRADLETGHPAAAAGVFGEWTRREARNDSVETGDGAWDWLSPARLEDGTVPADLIRNAGQQTGIEKNG
jgi:hypothetical protein